jgi:hypothetical protein
MCKRPLQDSGANGNKRQRLPGDDSEIIESEESEALPENYAGDTKESDSDRRGREKEERERQQTEEADERQRQRYAKSAAKMAASQSIPCLANIGGIRVEKKKSTTSTGELYDKKET